MGVPVYIERSRSGNGAHTWIFFSEPVPAKLARQLGTIILTKASLSGNNFDLKSYDRFFPNQDYLPKGGLGNLIALSLQKDPREMGNSVFIDSNSKPITDQWEYLSNIIGLNYEDITEIISTYVSNVSSVNFFESDEEEAIEAELGINIDDDEFTDCFNDRIDIVLDDKININTKNMPSKLIIALRRLATFANPDFFKLQRMRFSTWNTPKYIFCGEYFSHVLRLPRALLNNIESVLEKAGANIKIQDKRLNFGKMDLKFHGKLNDDQKSAVKEILNHEYGVLVAPTGSGKMIIAINIIAERKVPTLILVHRKQILTQWKKQIHEFLAIDKKDVGIIGSGKNKSTGIIDISMIQTIAKSDNVDLIKTKYAQVIIDECHHIPAVSFEMVLTEFPIRYCLGLTATPKRKDGHHPILYMQSGQICYEMREEISKEISRKVIFKETNFKMPEEYGEQPQIHEIWNELIIDRERLNLIVNDILENFEKKRHLLILSERKDHLYFLIDILKDKEQYIKFEFVLFTGDMSKKKRMQNLQIIKDCSDKNIPYCIFSTGSLIGEGFDLPELDTLFLAMPISFKGRVIQYAGRLHRNFQGKDEIIIYDYVDSSSGLTISMFKKRIIAYRKMGYKLISTKNAKIKKWIYKTSYT